MKIAANNLQLEVDIQGPADGEPLLLIMGLGMQLIAWPEALVAQLVARRFRVIRFDNRDIGLSEGFDHAGMPNLVQAGMRSVLGLSVTPAYHLRDMAHDALGVLDALGIQRAHVCGASMGGMIAQHLAAHHPMRVKSLTLIMTASGARRVSQPGWRVRQAMLSRPKSRDLHEVVAHMEGLWALIGSPAHRPDPVALRQRLEASVRRAYRPAGSARQLMAILADGDRSPFLGRITAPTAVIHGAADPLVPPAAGQDLANKIGGATLDLVPGMGHDLPEPLLPRIATGIAAAAARGTGG